MAVPRCRRCDRMLSPDETTCGGCGASVKRGAIGTMQMVLGAAIAVALPLALVLASGGGVVSGLIWYVAGAALAAVIYLVVRATRSKR